MSRIALPWLARRAAPRPLGQKLALSHLKVTLVAQLINLAGVGLILVIAGQSSPGGPGGEVAASAGPDRAMLILATIFFGGLFLLVSAISSAVAATMGLLLARGFARRLQAVASATEAIARGDLSARVDVGEADEIGQIALRFNQLTERLDAIERARRSFVSNISHELRTPLAIIRGHVEAQLAGSSAPPREALEAIDREAHALGTLIDDLFTLTRLEEAGMPLHIRPLAVQEIAAAAASGIAPLAARQGHVAVRSLVPADMPLALADPVRLAQILNNLLHNALRHTPAGGVIVIEGRPTPDGSALEIVVSDTGVGVAPADLPHIFDRFYRGQGDGGTGGGGLGLAIVKQLVEAQAGRIEAESTPGQGTTIRFTLPRAEF